MVGWTNDGGVGGWLGEEVDGGMDGKMGGRLV